MNTPNISYKEKISSRSPFRFLLGFIARLRPYMRNRINLFIARKNGAVIGKNSVISYKLAKIANSNLIIGNNTSVQSSNFDLRAKVSIGNHVIIGSNCQILTCGHDVDSTEFIFKPYGLTIEDFVWITTEVFITPSCRKIGYGSVCAAGSVVASNVCSMIVVGGNPAKEIKKRNNVHSDLVVESLLSCDLPIYTNSYIKREC